MKIVIVIPAYNEAAFLKQTLQSLIGQTKLPEKIIVVDDRSTDSTLEIAKSFSEKYSYIQVISSYSEGDHSPGSKVVQAFNEGLKHLETDYDIICKFDADLIFPPDYLEKIENVFERNPSTGMVGGHCTILKDEKWVPETLTDKDHIRGALKAYRKNCFLEIGKLKPAMGWDTVDELLAQYHGWKIMTISGLYVKHLKPTGASYNKSTKYKQGEAFYRLRYKLLITVIASAKLAFLKRNFGFFKDYLNGYFIAKKGQIPFLVSEEEGKFIRTFRWQKMLKKLF